MAHEDNIQSTAKSYKFLKQTCCGVLSVGRYPPLVNPHDAFGGVTETAVSEGDEVKITINIRLNFMKSITGPVGILCDV